VRERADLDEGRESPERGSYKERGEETVARMVQDVCRRPNGSRLSCGANAGRRKLPALRHLPAGGQT
jgi:hypothetical protein